MTAIRTAATALLLSAAASAYAQNDLVNCTWSDGRPMEAKLCAHLADVEQKQAAKKAAQAEAAARNAAADAARQADQAAADAARQADFERLAAERRAADSAAVAQTNAIARAADQAQQRAERQYEARMKQLQAECGADFQTPRVGMTLARARQCVGTLRLVSQVNRVDGVASVYRVGPLLLTVLQDRIVAWAR